MTNTIFIANLPTGTPTWYFAVNWTFTALDRVRLIFWTSSTWTAYVDNFYDPGVTTNSNFLAFF